MTHSIVPLASLLPGPVPSSPPREVDAAIELAAAAYERLCAEGHELRFEIDDRTGRLIVRLHDRDGQAPVTLSAREVLEIAAGAFYGALENLPQACCDPGDYLE
jgi:hypothetical protein